MTVAGCGQAVELPARKWICSAPIDGCRFEHVMQAVRSLVIAALHLQPGRARLARSTRQHATTRTLPLPHDQQAIAVWRQRHACDVLGPFSGSALLAVESPLRKIESPPTGDSSITLRPAH